MAGEEHYIYELQPQFVSKLELLRFDESATVVSAQNEAPLPRPQLTNHSDVGCTTCKMSLGQDRASHYKSDLHRLNVKRALNGLTALSEAEFEDILETQSLDSISGSEESDSEDEHESGLPTIFEKLSTADADQETPAHVSHMNTHSPFLVLRTPDMEPGIGLGVYKALFLQQVLSSGSIVEALQSLNAQQAKQGISVLLMIGGGHFAGAVVAHQRKNIDGNAKNHKESQQMQKVQVLHSKTFHRYTTRRKQGGSQSASDNARGKANSAGSSIRRYNEQALRKEVRDLLVSWKPYIQQAQGIYIRANGPENKKTLVGEDTVISADDPRVASFPFTTKRATLSEVKSAWTKLTYMETVKLSMPKSTKVEPRVKTPKSKSPEVVAESESDRHTREIVQILKKSKAPLMVNYMKQNKLDVDFEFTPAKQWLHTPTPLHYAAAHGLHHMVKVLLVNMKADPTRTNQSGKTACQIGTEQVKTTFQICRSTLGESYCDWVHAKVGPPRTSEEVALEEAREKKNKEEETRRMIQEELAVKTELETKKPTFSSGGRLGSGGKVGGGVLANVSDMSGLTEQQRMRFMREQRARAVEARMKKN